MIVQTLIYLIFTVFNDLSAVRLEMDLSCSCYITDVAFWCLFYFFVAARLLIVEL